MDRSLRVTFDLEAVGTRGETAGEADLAALRESVRTLLATRYSAEARRRLLGDPLGYDPATWQMMAAQLGLLELAIPERYGGLGACAAAVQVVFEELGAALYSGPYFACVGLAVPALLTAADEEACSEYLPRIADGSLIATLAATEPGRGWDMEDIATTARLRGSDRWTLTGAKAYVVDAASAGVVFVTAQTEAGIGLFAVDPVADGCSTIASPPLDLTRRLARMELTDAPARLLSRNRDASAELTLAREASMVALTGEQVGGAAACLDMAVGYARRRRQFGRPIGQFQAIKHLCADMLSDLESAGALAHQLARAADAGADLALHAAMAKALCSDAYFTIAARMIQVHGGIGFTWEHDAHLYYRRAKSAQLMFGDSAWQRRRVADLLGL
jgi:alkylation response protein AidB-like acyl-CoA dehydrogenase